MPAAISAAVSDPAAAWADAAWLAALVAVHPRGLGGVVLQARSGPQRELWLKHLGQLWPGEAAPRRMPLHIGDERLLGGLDLGASLQAGRPVLQRGLLAEADGGLLLISMAERLQPGQAARLAQVLDAGEVCLARDGFDERLPARLALVAMDESAADSGDDSGAAGPQLPAALQDRLAATLALDHLPLSWVEATGGGAGSVGSAIRGRAEAVMASQAPGREDVIAARHWLPAVAFDADGVAALSSAALQLGILGTRPVWLAWQAARAAAALRGHGRPEADDLALAARLVLAPRATALPEVGIQGAEAAAESEAIGPPANDEPANAASEAATQQTPPAADTSAGPVIPSEPTLQPPQDLAASETPQDDQPAPATDQPGTEIPETLPELVLEAALAALPPQTLARLADQLGAARQGAARATGGGRSGAVRVGHQRGRTLTPRRGAPDGRARIDLLASLRAAMPWQPLRRQETQRLAAAPPAATPASVGIALPATGRMIWRREDIHLKRHAQRRETTTVFVVDASGSAALHRLAEAKGAVELLLAECYVRRDQVALISFRGQGAEVLLPPTRSLVRAKRALAGLPGGGATPLAAALHAAGQLAEGIVRRGGSVLLAFLTDGRANITRAGQPGREAALDEALAAAHQLRPLAVQCLMVDTTPLRSASLGVGPPPARQVAEALGARYLCLPQAQSGSLARVIRDQHAASA